MRHSVSALWTWQLAWLAYSCNRYLTWVSTWSFAHIISVQYLTSTTTGACRFSSTACITVLIAIFTLIALLIVNLLVFNAHLWACIHYFIKLHIRFTWSAIRWKRWASLATAVTVNTDVVFEHRYWWWTIIQTLVLIWVQVWVVLLYARCASGCCVGASLTRGLTLYTLVDWRIWNITWRTWWQTVCIVKKEIITNSTLSAIGWG
jgi:hypothetical protein